MPVDNKELANRIVTALNEPNSTTVDLLADVDTLTADPALVHSLAGVEATRLKARLDAVTAIRKAVKARMTAKTAKVAVAPVPPVTNV